MYLFISAPCAFYRVIWPPDRPTNCNPRNFARTQAIFARIGLLACASQRKVVVATCVPYISLILHFVGFLTPYIGFGAVTFLFTDRLGREQVQSDRIDLGKVLRVPKILFHDSDSRECLDNTKQTANCMIQNELEKRKLASNNSIDSQLLRLHHYHHQTRFNTLYCLFHYV